MGDAIFTLEQQLPGLSGYLRLDALLNLASELWQRDPPQAVLYSQEAYVLATSLNHASAQAMALLELGRSQFRTGAYQEATLVLERAIASFQIQDDAVALARSWMALGSVRTNLGLRTQALRALFLAQIIFEDAGNTWYLADCLNNIGVLYGKIGDYDASLSYHSRALILAKSVDSHFTKIAATNNIGQQLYSLRRWSEALPIQLEALLFARESGSIYNEIVALINIGCTLSSIGRYDESEEHLQKALRLSRKSDDSENILSALDEFGILSCRRGEYKTAIRYYREALKVAALSGATVLEAELYLNLGEAMKALGQRRAAHTALLRALDSAEQHDLLKLRSRIHLQLSIYYEEDHQTGQASAHREQHLELERASQHAASEQRSAVLLLEQEYEVQASGGLLAETPSDRSGNLDRFQAVKSGINSFRKPRGKVNSAELLDLSGLKQALKQAFQASRDENQPLALALLEIGDVPTADDTAALLKAISLMQRTMPSKAVYSLLKGRVLGVLLPGTSPRRAWTLCEGWRRTVEDGFSEQSGGSTAVHLGLCTQTAWSRAEDMLSCADRLLYQAKCLGPGPTLSDWKP
ncbi:tetratricopeptide repeat protein (plasmid) [Deinococcus sp. KNUC1210]|uniref:tetratricopeptide repeat protein n=1 Tax=Deinococcus sp. KNUC1210 TaxID=2917691 RepID=UPI001EF001DE|nr:tetratricopeptide repeat protein [Deinococcus sp. KNUC1210]ULH13843.1 tetratricopeptide repeat protein [Deinococcus sp. KNUC1210]